jgi:hypothetical protein
VMSHHMPHCQRGKEHPYAPNWSGLLRARWSGHAAAPPSGGGLDRLLP